MSASCVRTFIHLISFLFCFSGFAQDIPIGYWRDMLPYTRAISVTDAGDVVYCATTSSLFYFDKSDNSITTLSKVTGLSDIGISCILYNKTYDVLVIAYTNTNIDMVSGTSLTNLSDIKRKNMVGKKAINSIYFYGRFAYLSCSFGIVVVDIVKKEISETWYIGSDGSALNVNEVVIDGTSIIAATDKGVYRADYTGSNLADYASWSRDVNGLPHDAVLPDDTFYLFTEADLVNGYPVVNFKDTWWDLLYRFDGNSWSVFIDFEQMSLPPPYNIQNSPGKLIVTHPWGVTVFDSSGNSISGFGFDFSYKNPIPYDALLDEDGIMWVADIEKGLVKHWGDWGYEIIVPDGPFSKNTWNIYASGSNLWVAPGTLTPQLSNTWNGDGVFYYLNNDWDRINFTGVDSSFDIVRVLIDPKNSERVFAGAWGSGVLEFRNKVLTNKWDEETTGGVLQLEIPYKGYVRIPSMVFDRNHRLWVTNFNVTRPLCVMDTSGDWKSFPLKGSPGKTVLDITVDSNNIKWVIIGGFGIFAFDENGTVTDETDDRSRYLTTGVGYGDLPTNYLNCIVADLTGDIWIGTSKGIAVFYTPWMVFDSDIFDAQQILVFKDGYWQYLLEFEEVTAMAVDGANRKWIGTRSAGVFLVSPDGTQEIHHFTSSNSPLPSDEITSIAINQAEGEIFFGTTQGIVSYRSTATMGGTGFADVFVYPNPIREDYEGPIAINGLVANARVKITDISGGLIFETIADGGQAIWDGKNFTGRKASTGVYLIFCSNLDGSETIVAKIMIIN